MLFDKDEHTLNITVRKMDHLSIEIYIKISNVYFSKAYRIQFSTKKCSKSTQTIK